jgi:predicted RNA-binding protein YlqC (UPF0109 family)
MDNPVCPILYASTDQIRTTCYRCCMADVRSSRVPLLVCLAVSLFLHAAIIVTLARPDSFLSTILRLRSEEVPDEVRLGIDESELMSIAWIGFAESTPHSAVKSETLQPELSADAVTASARAADQAIRQIANAASVASESLLERLSNASELIAMMQQQREQTVQAERAEQAETQNEAQQQIKSEPIEPTKKAIQDDRESDATSPEIQVRTNELGKVLARQGLRIQTFRPKFDATTKQHELRSRQGSVTAIIRFTKDGSVVSASIKPGTESGQSTIDEPILDSVYKWRASGRDLEELPDQQGAGLTVNIQILF